MLKQRPAEIHHNLRKRKVKNALLFPQALSGFDSPLFKKQKAPCWVPLFFGADEGKT